MSAPSEQTILVTGANGFIGGHVLKQALEKGYHVRGLVRRQKATVKYAKLFAQYADQLSWALISDFTVVDDYESAFACPTKPITGIIHLASPFKVGEDPKRDVLEPAVAGAVTILDAGKKFGGSDLKRIVVTSSFLAIVDWSQGLRPGYTYTSDDWNPLGWESADMGGMATYMGSKVLAERAVWDWVKANAGTFTFDVATMNMPWVWGGHLGGVGDYDSLTQLNQSSMMLSQLLDGAEIPPVDFAGFVDVKDTAAAHVAALEKPEASGQRLLFGSHFTYQRTADVLREVMPEIRDRIPEGTPGKYPDVYAIDGSKASELLGVGYTPLEQTMKDTFAEIVQIKDCAKESAVAA